MNGPLLIIYEPGLFLLAALGWAGWELWSMRARKDKAVEPDRAPPEPPGLPQ